MTTTTAQARQHERRSRLRHPAWWIAAFFGLLIVLEVIFFTVAGSLPSDQLPPEADATTPDRSAAPETSTTAATASRSASREGGPER